MAPTIDRRKIHRKLEGPIQDGYWTAAYQDTGCEYSPSCLECPLPVCKEDMTQTEQARLRATSPVYAVHDRLCIEHPHLAGTVELMKMVGADVGLTTRTVWRYLERRRKEHGL